MITDEKRAVAAIAQVIPSVVSIDLATPSASPARSKKFVDSARNSQSSAITDGGSGFVIDTSGIIVTNIHVIEPSCRDYNITAWDGSLHHARLLSADIVHDIAFLKMDEEKKLPAITLGDSSKIKLGQGVLAIGNVLGLFQNTVSAGIVSGLSRNVNAHSKDIQEELRGLIQTDAAINPGNSGGPLITLDGKVIGINSASVTRAENIGFAIPINVVKKDLTALKKHGAITRAFLGVRYVMLDQNTAHFFKTPHTAGALIIAPSPHHQAVIPDSPAARVGLRPGDVIIAANGKLLTPQYALQDFLDSCSEKESVALTVVRGKKRMFLTVRLMMI